MDRRNRGVQLGLHGDPIKNHLLSFVLLFVLSLSREGIHTRTRLYRLFEHCVWTGALLGLLDAINELGNAVPPRGAMLGGFLVLLEGVVERLERGYFDEDVLLNSCSLRAITLTAQRGRDTQRLLLVLTTL